MRERFGMDRLLADRGDEHLDAVLGQNRRRAHVGLIGAQHRGGALESAVAEGDDAPGPPQRILARPFPAPTETRHHALDPGPVRLSGGGGIMHDADQGALGALRQEFGNQPGGVGGGTRPRVVLCVSQDDRGAGATREADRLGDSLRHGERAMGGKGGLGGNKRRKEPIRRGIGRPLVAAIRGDARAGVSDIGGRKAHVEREVDSGLGLDGLQLRVEPLGWLDIGATAGDRDQERRLPKGARRARVPGEHAIEPSGAAPPGGAPIHMRIGAVG